jgi:hypothetical protein
VELDPAILQEAVARGIISNTQAEQVWRLSSEHAQHTPGFRFTHILYYLGGLIAIGAMTLFVTLGWERLGGWGLMLIALAYAAAGLGLAEYLLKRLRQPIPAGIAAAFVVALTPLAVYGLQKALGFWVEGQAYRDYHRLIDWRWITMELATLATGAGLLWRYRLPFMVMPVALTLWYMSMDLTPLLFRAEDQSMALRKMVSLWFGLAMLLLALWTDVRSRRGKDFAFWLYLFGLLAFWGGLSLMRSDSQFDKFVYLCINLLLIAAGAVLSRRMFVVFGGLGTAAYLGDLSYGLFKDSMVFPFALTAIGLGLVLLGILWQRYEARITEGLLGLLPVPARTFLMQRR